MFSHDGMLEILPLVFAIVAECLRRKEVQASRAANDDDTGDTSLRGNLESVCHWLIDEHESLISAIKDLNTDEKPILDKRESTKYILMSVLEAVEMCTKDEVRKKNDCQLHSHVSLDASTHLYKRVCPSVRPYVLPSLRFAFFSNALKTRIFDFARRGEGEGMGNG